MRMARNVGGLDRAARILIGIALLLLALFAGWETAWRALAAIVGAIALVTGVTAYCPANQMLGIDTHRPETD